MDICYIAYIWGKIVYYKKMEWFIVACQVVQIIHIKKKKKKKKKSKYK